MPNLTISVDEDVIRQARIRAIGQGTSVSAKVREFLRHYARGDEPATQPAWVAPVLPAFNGTSGLHKGIDPSSNKSLLAAAEK